MSNSSELPLNMKDQLPESTMGECLDHKSSMQGFIQAHKQKASSLPQLADVFRKPSPRYPFIIGWKETPAGAIPRVSHQLSRSDILGMARVRIGIGRMDYRLPPGLYALGDPDATSEVLATANYKLTFDCLRSKLVGLNLWIIVLDTDGINVWCAAGKGSFSTQKLVRQIEATKIGSLVSHRRIIVPQLAASGVCAREVRSVSGFRVIFGPIESRNLPQFLDSGFHVSQDMRTKTFDIWERIVLIPIELLGALRKAAIALPVLFFVACLAGSGSCWSNLTTHGILAGIALLTGVAAGAVATPVLLPWLPGRAFTIKGLTTGILAGIGLALATSLLGILQTGRIEVFSWILIIMAVSAFLAMNFTGASTFTSLSGVKREMRWAVPAQIALVAAGVIGWLWSLSTA